jgi:hypothetical protein
MSTRVKNLSSRTAQWMCERGYDVVNAIMNPLVYEGPRMRGIYARAREMSNALACPVRACHEDHDAFSHQTHEGL